VPDFPLGITGFAFMPTHPGDWAPDQLLLFDYIVQIKTAAVKGMKGIHGI